MPHDFITRRDSEFLQWSRVFSAAINNSPATYGLNVGQASEYASLHDAFAAAYRIALDPALNSISKVMAKNIARRSAERAARLLARIIQATSTVTDVQRVSIGLTVRDMKPSRVPPPHQPPRLFVKLLHGSTVRIILLAKESDRRGKPEGVAGAMIYSFVGDTPPDSLSEWKSEGGTTKPRFNLTLTGPNLRPGAKVWFTAYWYSPRAQRGPACMPKSTYIQCPTMMLGQALKLAA